MTTQKNKLEKGITPSCNIHTVKKDTFSSGPKGGRKEKLGEEE